MAADVFPALAGLVLALVTGVGARLVGMDRDRALYPVVLVVIATYYGLFAAIDTRPGVVLTELALMLPFVAAALLGFKRSPWLVVAGLVCHGVQDLLHARIVVNTGVPGWWPVFCLVYDVALALYLAALLAGSAASATSAASKP
jgi:hypothetical protein